MAIGRDDAAAHTNRQLSDAFWSKGIWHAMRWWDGWSHDWPYWQQMILHYINGAD
jgi:esterase/lipase superfamily enzyme